MIQRASSEVSPPIVRRSPLREIAAQARTRRTGADPRTARQHRQQCVGGVQSPSGSPHSPRSARQLVEASHRAIGLEFRCSRALSIRRATVLAVHPLGRAGGPALALGHGSPDSPAVWAVACVPRCARLLGRHTARARRAAGGVVATPADARAGAQGGAVRRLCD
jgi:hypothetical protein